MNNPQEQHDRIKRRIRLVGFICLGIGLICTVIGLVDFFTAFNGSGMPSKFFLLFIGFPLLAIGGSALSIGYRREMMRYV